MTAEEFANIAATTLDVLEFEYDGKYGNIDRYGNRTTQEVRYLLLFDGKETWVDSKEKVITTPFLDGKTVSEVIDKMDVYNP